MVLHIRGDVRQSNFLGSLFTFQASKALQKATCFEGTISLYVIYVIAKETFRKDNKGFKCWDINCEESSEVYFFQSEIALVTLPLNPPVLYLSWW